MLEVELWAIFLVDILYQLGRWRGYILPEEDQLFRPQRDFPVRLSYPSQRNRGTRNHMQNLLKKIIFICLAVKILWNPWIWETSQCNIKNDLIPYHSCCSDREIDSVTTSFARHQEILFPESRRMETNTFFVALDLSEFGHAIL